MNTRFAQSAFGAVLLAIILAPVAWLFLLSFKPIGETYSLPIRWLPQNPTLDAYRQIWFSGGLSSDWVTYLVNTSAVSVFVAAISAFGGLYMGYVLARSRQKWVRPVLVLIVVVQLLNGPALIVPVYALANALGLYNTLVGYAAVLVAFMLPFATLISVGYAKDMPIDLEEAGYVDGATRGQVFRRIFVPLARPAILTTGLMTFLLTWGEYPFAIVLLESRENLTVARGMFELISGLNIYWNQMAAAAVVVSLPVLVVLLIAQRYLVRGLMSGATKG